MQIDKQDLVRLCVNETSFQRSRDVRLQPANLCFSLLARQNLLLFRFFGFFSFLWWIQLRERSDVCFCWRALIMRSTTDGKLSLGNFLYRHSATCNAIFSRLSMLSWWASSINEGVEPKAERRHDEKEQARLVATSSWWKQEAFSIKSNSAKRTSDGCVLVRAKFRIHKIMLNCCNLMKKIIVDWCPHDYAIKTNTHRLQF